MTTNRNRRGESRDCVRCTRGNLEISPLGLADRARVQGVVEKISDVKEKSWPRSSRSFEMEISCSARGTRDQDFRHAATNGGWMIISTAAARATVRKRAQS